MTSSILKPRDARLPGRRAVPHPSAPALAAGLVLAAMALALGAPRPARADQGKVLAAWEFNTAGNRNGWTGENEVGKVKVAGGAISVTATGGDPFIVHDVFAEPIITSPTQVIEVRINSPVQADAQFYWTNTTHTQYEGFSPGKNTTFQLQRGWHDYTVRPFWQGEGKIIKLRLDFPDNMAGRTYQVDYIRVVEMGQQGKPVVADWDFAYGPQGWRVEGEGKIVAQGEPGAEQGWLVADLKPGARLVAPPVDVDASRYQIFGFVMAVTGGTSGTIHWASDQANGLHDSGFPTIADGKPHVYNVIARDEAWAGRIIYLDLEPSLGSACRVRLNWFRVAANPTGPAEVDVRRFMIADPLARAGRPCEVVAWLENRGGVARNLRAQLVLPAGVEMAPGEKAAKVVEDLDYFAPEEVTWHIVVAKPGEVKLGLRLSGPVQQETEVTQKLLPLLHLPKASYVPEPKPVHGAYDVGVYYFPGWYSWDRWQPIMPYPERKPVLGWYKEGSPEVADWQIKYAVEHGITFFCYDWYWNQGHQSLTQGLDAYFKSRYHNLLKFCLLWANHSPTVHSPEDDVKVCQYWIDNYFRRSDYYKLNGRPVVVIFSPYAMQRDLGVDGSRKAIELWHKMTKDAGVGEIMVVACGNPSNLETLKAQGFDAVSGYNWPSCGVSGRNYVPYSEVARNQYNLWWMPMAKKNLMPVIVPACGGWDARPWHGQKSFVLTDRTPQAFEEGLRLAKRFVDETHEPKVVLVEAWNEFGEGSYCEPERQYGFGYLDALRRVFCPKAKPSEDYAPIDVGLGPYDCPAPKSNRTAWEFAADNDSGGWGPMMGVSDFRVADGCLAFQTTDSDPAISCGVKIRAEKVKAVEVRMSLTGVGGEDGAQVFWSTPLAGTSEEASVRAPIADDGQMHVLRFDVGDNMQWRGLITGLRFDPSNKQGVTVKIGYIKLLP